MIVTTAMDDPANRRDLGNGLMLRWLFEGQSHDPAENFRVALITAPVLERRLAASVAAG